MSKNSVSLLMERLANMSENNTDWSKPRDASLYDLIEFDYPFGKRKAFKKTDNSLYEELQASRGNNFDIEKSLDENIDKIAEMAFAPLNELDSQRLSEIVSFGNSGVFPIDSILNFVEIGFRLPKFMKIFRDNFDKKVWGYDVVEMNVEIARILGFDSYVCDLNEPVCDLDIGNDSLIFCYHVIEHVTDPLQALQRIGENMGKNCYLHVEVPLENRDIPNINVAHLFAFKPGDLDKMLALAGFKKVAECMTQADTERYLVTKRS